MKNLKERLINESKGWEVAQEEFAYDANKEYLWLNTEGEQLGFVSIQQIKEWDEEGSVGLLDGVKKLKVGEMYDADGGINLYVKIK